MLSGPKLRNIQVLSSDVFPTRHARRMEHMHPNDAKRKMVAFGYICCFSSSSHVSRSDHQKTRARISELKTFEKVRFSVAQTEFCQFEENLQENTATGPFLSFFFAFFHFLSSSSVWHVTVTIWCIFSGFVGASDPGGRQLYVAVSCGGTSLCGYKYFCPVRPSTKFTVSNAAHKAFIVYCKFNRLCLRWVLPQPTRSPIFVGETARKYTPCVTPPNPILPETNSSSTAIHANQSIISWPPTDHKRPFDAYLSDCVSGTFCSSSHVCIQHYSDGEPCQSTNQCNAETSQCYNGFCTNMATDNPWAEKQSDSKSHTAIIVAIVIGILILLAVPAAACYYYHRRRKHPLSQIFDKQHPPASSSPPHPPPPASHIILSDEPASSTPTMQQQALQYQLQRWQNAHESKDIHPPPPPYTP